MPHLPLKNSSSATSQSRLNVSNHLPRVSSVPACADISGSASEMPSNVKFDQHNLTERMKSAAVRTHPRRVVLETRSEATLNRNALAKRTWRIIVMGSAKVGKTCILSRFIHKRFPDRTSSRAVDEMHRLDYNIGGQTITTEILDTSGYANFPAMKDVAIRQADAFILVFSTDSEESLEFVRDLRQEIIRIKQHEQRCTVFPMVVVCNKMDNPEPQRTVDLNYVEFLVKCDWENCGLVKASAKEDYGIQESFKELLLGLKLGLPRNTVINRVRGGLSRMHSAPAGLRPDTAMKFGSPKLLQKFRDRTSAAVQEDECIIS